MTAHSVKVCQYSMLHGQCDCPGKGPLGYKPLEVVDCNMPDLHRPLETESKGWVQGDSVEDEARRLAGGAGAQGVPALPV